MLNVNSVGLKITATVLLVLNLVGCGGGGGEGTASQLSTSVTSFYVIDKTNNDPELQLSDKFQLEATFSTPNLTYVDYDVAVFFTGASNSASDDEPLLLFAAECLNRGDCSYSQDCKVYENNQRFYIDCSKQYGESPLDITSFVPELPTTLIFEVSACSKDACEFGYTTLTIEQDATIGSDLMFVASQNADLDKTYESNTIVVSDINSSVNIHASAGTLFVNGTQLPQSGGIVKNGDEVSIKLKSGTTNGVITATDIYIGDSLLTYSVITGENFNEGYAFISNGKYSGEGVSFYYLTMESPGRLDFNDVGNRSNLTILDLGLNEVYGPTSNTNRFLSAGSYIVKIFNSSMYDYMTLYSPVLGGAEELVVLTDGDYRHEGAAYFRLDMSQKGNINFSDTGNRSHLAVYDPDLKTIFPRTSRGTHTLEIGSYIVKIYNQSTLSYMTVNIAQ